MMVLALSDVYAQKSYYKDDSESSNIRQNVLGLEVGGLGILIPQSDGVGLYRIGFTGSAFFERRFSEVVALRIPFSINVYSRQSNIFDSDVKNVDVSNIAVLGGLGLRFYNGNTYGVEFYVGPSVHFGGIVSVSSTQICSVNLDSREAFLIQAFTDAGVVFHLAFLRIDLGISLGYQGDFPNQEKLKNVSPEHKFASRISAGIGIDF
ncbi:hypothetical protein CHS0354_023789 [Potamilus streckersoni]|uniref:Outer membrane protein beta-barrel domain-containing protein n=1 Tax=Potamilus streckersoni TaxID=2493646 RepID=A0AAE0RZL8_9BIVA|nr:hypothetical protein CHS0354_023789 [Potamilus streckersoni]